MTQRVITGFFLLIFVLLPFGTSAGLLPALDTSSPYATMRSFHQKKQRIATLYEAYRSNPSDRTQRALIIAVRRAADQLLDMSNVPPATQTKEGARSLIELADIFLRLPDIAAETIPGAPEQASTPIPSRWTIPGTELRIERVSQGDAPPDFRFSAATVARLS